jgi:2-dehydro-3-deoxyphosphogluconate aldolase / (4S)-4-hydroxy-2-oxoglutarate aldolase
MSQASLERLLAGTPVVPVLVVDSLAVAIPLARALVAGGLRILEITLRTTAALDVIRAIGEEVEGAVVGAGTVLTPEQLEQVGRPGVRFAVSPGSTQTLLDAARDSSVPLLPGAATASEVMGLLELGYRFMKFFPAEPAGGIAYLKAVASPLPEARFCPTGGIDAERARAYLSLTNVVCVGGSWVAPSNAVRTRDWMRITRLARQAAALRDPIART